MTRQQLRAFLGEWFCGCGTRELAVERLRDLLALHPLYDNGEALERLVPDIGLQMLLLYTLDYFGLTEHGSSVGSGWLTEKGKAVLAALNAEAPDFEALTPACCIHGYSVEDDEIAQCEECQKLNP